MEQEPSVREARTKDRSQPEGRFGVQRLCGG